MSTLQDRLAELRKENPRVSNADLAKAAGVKPPSVSEWFNGETKSLKAKSLRAVASLYRVNPEWVLDGKGLKHYQQEAIDNFLESAAEYQVARIAHSAGSGKAGRQQVNADTIQTVLALMARSPARDDISKLVGVYLSNPARHEGLLAHICEMTLGGALSQDGEAA